jgi:hypothetical protein
MWHFDQPPDTATLVSTSVLDEGHPILFVSHDEEDHGWQFLDGSEPPTPFQHACMSHVVGSDPTLPELADLPPGWCAWREAPDQPWQRGKVNEDES